MTNFLDKYAVISNTKSSLRNSIDITPEEKNKQKLIDSIDQQLVIVENFIADKSTSIYGNSEKKPRLFWQEILGGYLFTPRFGNDFMFGKNRGVHCTSYEELRDLISDFRIAVLNNEFDDRIQEIASSRKGRGAGVPRSKS